MSLEIKIRRNFLALVQVQLLNLKQKSVKDSPTASARYDVRRWITGSLPTLLSTNSSQDVRDMSSNATSEQLLGLTLGQRPSRP